MQTTGEIVIKKEEIKFDHPGWWNSAGMTLLEVVIAMLFFTIGVLAVAAMQVIGMQFSTQAAVRAGDCIAASGYMEKILSWSYDDSRITDPDDGFKPRSPDHGPFEMESRGATIEWEVDARSPVANVKRIFVTVRRNSGKGVMLVHTYNTIKPKCSVLMASGGKDSGKQ